MRLTTIAALAPVAALAQNTTLLTDINTISQYWGQISTYRDNDEALFGVQNVGLPDGCQIEQVKLSNP